MMRLLAPRPLAVLLGGVVILVLTVCAHPGPPRPGARALTVEVWDWAQYRRARSAHDSTREAVGDTAIYLTMDSIAGARMGRSAAAYRAWRDSTQAGFDTLGRVLVAAIAGMIRDTALTRGDTTTVRRIDSLVAAEAESTPRRQPRWRQLPDTSIRWVGIGSCGMGWSGSSPGAVGADRASVSLQLRCRGARAGEQTIRIQAPLAHGWTVHAAHVRADGPVGAAGDSAVAMLRAPQPGDSVIGLDVRLRAAAGATTSARVVIEVQGPVGTDPYPRYVRSRRSSR